MARISFPDGGRKTSWRCAKIIARKIPQRREKKYRLQNLLAQNICTIKINERVYMIFFCLYMPLFRKITIEEKWVI